MSHPAFEPLPPLGIAPDDLEPIRASAMKLIDENFEADPGLALGDDAKAVLQELFGTWSPVFVVRGQPTPWVPASPG